MILGNLNFSIYIYFSNSCRMKIYFMEIAFKWIFMDFLYSIPFVKFIMLYLDAESKNKTSFIHLNSIVHNQYYSKMYLWSITCFIFSIHFSLSSPHYITLHLKKFKSNLVFLTGNGVEVILSHAYTFHFYTFNAGRKSFNIIPRMRHCVQYWFILLNTKMI